MEEVLPPHIAAIARQAMQEASAHGVSSGHEYELDLAAGVQHFELSVAVKPTASGRAGGFVVVARDITQKQQHQKALEKVAHFDALTGLPNRVLLSDRLNQAMAHSLRSGLNLAVVFLDLDGFKAVNDQHGHEVGDQLLMALAQRLKTALREGDTLARIGGDEFVAVLVGLEDMGGCMPVLQRLLHAAADPVQFADARVQVSASLGVTLFPQDAADADQLMRHADQAMYQAKQAGKNQYHLFDVETDTAVKTQTVKLARIAQALSNNELVLHYQPQVNMRTGQLVGVEALVRWQHPDDGLLAPGHFLPVLEGKPLAADLDEWVLDEAFAQLSAWQAQGFEVPVSVNVCAASLQKPGFVRRLVQRQVAHPSLARELIKLEMLETSALEDMAGTANVMRACRLIGVKFALDDFGTGYSSLTYLRRLPAEQLKIDQSFVRDMLEDPDDMGIVLGIMGLAGAFNLEVIAEGVETVAHGEHLLMLGCDLAQGYGIARPMPAGQLQAWASSWVQPASWQAQRTGP
jgi:diguanylate cyclase (GGDEF)-like protein